MAREIVTATQIPGQVDTKKPGQVMTSQDLELTIKGNENLKQLSRALFETPLTPENKQRRIEEMHELAQAVTAFRDGQLKFPTMDEAFKARGDEKVAILSRTLQATIASEIFATGTVPERSKGLKDRTGHMLNEALKNLGLADWEGVELLRAEVINALPRTLQIVLFHYLGTSRLIELGYPNMDIASEEQVADYLDQVGSMVLGTAKTIGKDLTPTEQQKGNFEELAEALEDRILAGGHDDGYLPLDSRKVMDILLAKERGKWVVAHLIQVADTSPDVFPALRLLLRHHQETTNDPDRYDDLDNWENPNVLQDINRPFFLLRNKRTDDEE